VRVEQHVGTIEPWSEIDSRVFGLEAIKKATTHEGIVEESMLCFLKVSSRAGNVLCTFRSFALDDACAPSISLSSDFELSEQMHDS